MTPFNLFSMLREMLAEECGCKVCWGQHPHALSADELRAIRSRVLQILNAQSPQVVSNVNQVRQKGA